MIPVGSVIQFNENHKWCGTLGIVTEAKPCGDNGIRYMVGVPIPAEGTAFIFVMESEYAIEYIGIAAFVVSDKENGDE